MIQTVTRLGVATLFCATALLAAGCDQHHDGASNLDHPHGAQASVQGMGDAHAVGSDEAIEDSALTASVREAILADPQLRSQNIDVAIEDSAVTLTGTVDSPALRDRAIELAGSVNGVAHVQERLEVRP